jgi:twitching motility protein PilT
MLKEIYELAKKQNASDVHLYANQPVFYRRFGRLYTLENVAITEEHIKKIILETSSLKARQILGRYKQVTYATNIDGESRVRFSVYFDKGKFALSLRLISDKIPELQEIGLPDQVKKALSQRSGLILVGSPAGEGKTTTISAIINFFNNHFEKNIVTIENPVEHVFKENKSAIIQRSIPVDVSNFYTGLSELSRINPDIVVSDSLNYPDAMDKALSLCENGATVIGGTEGGDAMQIIDRIINLRPNSERELLRIKLASQLRVIIGQRLIAKADGSERKGIFDICINTSQIKNLIKSNNFTMFRTIQDGGKADGMLTFDNQLMELTKTQFLTKKEASEYAIEKNRFL